MGHYFIDSLLPFANIKPQVRPDITPEDRYMIILEFISELNKYYWRLYEKANDEYRRHPQWMPKPKDFDYQKMVKDFENQRDLVKQFCGLRPPDIFS